MATVLAPATVSLVTLVVAGSCASISGDPPLHRRVGAFAVRGVDAQRAELVAETIAARRQSVQDALGSLARDVDRCEVIVRSRQGEESDGIAHQAQDDRQIELNIGSDAAERVVEMLVVHELAHVYFGDGRSRVPAIVEEGLCEWIAQHLVRESAVERRAEHLVNLATAIEGAFRFEERSTEHGPGVTWTLRASIEPQRLPNPVAALSLSHDELLEITPEENRLALTSFGFLLVERIGLPRLVELVEEARSAGDDAIPVATLLAAAGLDPHDTSRWMPSVRALASPEQILEAIRAPDSRIHLTSPPSATPTTPAGRPELVRTARGG